jgi:hypothetical protein
MVGEDAMQIHIMVISYAYFYFFQINESRRKISNLKFRRLSNEYCAKSLTKNYTHGVQR